MTLQRIMICRFCGNKYWLYGYEVRKDPSVCKECENSVGSKSWSHTKGKNDPIHRFYQ